jgi:hypothetical protein
MGAVETLAIMLTGCVFLAAAAGPGGDLQGARSGARAAPPWPPQYKQGGTAADVLGPDGKTWFPDWTYAGVQGGIPDVEAFGRIEDFGGRADDDADDSEALQKACDAAGAAGGGAVLLGEGTYYLDQKVRITHSGVVIRGAGRDKTKIVIRYNGRDNRITDGIITFAGGENAEERLLAADGRRGDMVLILRGVPDLAAGDWIVVDAPGTPRWRELIDSSCRLTPRMAIVRVEMVEGNCVAINQPLRIDFPIIDGSRIQTAAPIERCGVEDLYLTQVNRDPKICTVLFDRAVNCWGRRVTVEWTGRMPLYGSNVKWMEVRDCEFNDAHDMGGAGTAYVGWQYSDDCLMENVTTHNMRHAPNLDWACSGCVFRNCTFYYSDGQTHSGWCHENLWENCVIIDPRGRPAGGGSYGYGFWVTPPSDTSHGPNGPRNCFYNCDFQNSREHVVFEPDMLQYGPAGLVLGGMNENWLFFYNRVLSCGPGILLRGVQFDHVIKGNVFAIENDFAAVVAEDPQHTSGLEIDDNAVYGGSGAVFAGAPSDAQLDGNRTLAKPADGPPPRPQPAVPSIFEWERRNLR